MILKYTNKIMRNKPFILFITGISCSGKSSLYKSLKRSKRIPKSIIIHDIDENGVPEVGRDPWRSFRVEELFHKAIQNAKKRISTIICGISLPHEVIDSPQYQTSYNIDFLLLDISHKEHTERSKARHKRYGGYNLKKSIRDNKQLSRRLKSQIINQKNHFIINTEKYTKRKTLNKIINIIKKLNK